MINSIIFWFLIATDVFIGILWSLYIVSTLFWVSATLCILFYYIANLIIVQNNLIDSENNLIEILLKRLD